MAKPVPDGVEVAYAGKDVDLGNLLEAGEIDALISADSPKCVLEKSPRVGRLFDDYEDAERDYFRRTGEIDELKGRVADTRVLMKVGLDEPFGARIDLRRLRPALEERVTLISWHCEDVDECDGHRVYASYARPTGGLSANS